MNKALLKYSIGLTSFLLAGIAAYFSITGLAKLFAGTGAAILVMASALEFSKLLTVSYLYRFWSGVSKALKVYLTIAVFILMMITSLGIYGFLTAGYQDTKAKFDIANTGITSLQNQKKLFDMKIQSITNIIESNKNRIESLNSQRNNIERRIEKSFDSNRFNISNKQSNNAKLIDTEIQSLINKNDLLENNKLALSDSSSTIDVLIIQTKLTNQTSTELGPLVYVSNLTGVSLDIIVNILIVLFIFVFDPLAIVLLIVFNSLSDNDDTVTNLKNIESNTTDSEQYLEEQVQIEESIVESTVQIVEPPKHTNLPKLYSDGR